MTNFDGESGPEQMGKPRTNERQEPPFRSRTARAFDFMRQQLERDAARVTPRDIDEVSAAVPKKLEGLDVEQLKEDVGWFGELLGRIRTLWDMIRDRDFQIDWKTKALIAAGLLYFVLPTDFTPDFIPGIGYIDDALVLATLWRMVSSKIDEYVEFRSRSSAGM
jgi:uncharacterized membrane protein YkvA (DUF1232 family)